jgi:hypothetical protein
MSLIVSSLEGLNLQGEPRTQTRESRAGEDATQLCVVAHYIGDHDLLIYVMRTEPSRFEGRCLYYLLTDDLHYNVEALRCLKVMENVLPQLQFFPIDDA